MIKLLEPYSYVTTYATNSTKKTIRHWAGDKHPWWSFSSYKSKQANLKRFSGIALHLPFFFYPNRLVVIFSTKYGSRRNGVSQRQINAIHSNDNNNINNNNNNNNNINNKLQKQTSKQKTNT